MSRIALVLLFLAAFLLGAQLPGEVVIPLALAVLAAYVVGFHFGVEAQREQGERLRRR